MEDIFIVLIIFGSFFGVTYVFFITRHKERLALIEKGADAKLFNSGKKISWANFTLSTGSFLIGIGVGIAAGAFLASAGISEDVAYPSMIFLFAGIGLVSYFFLARKLRKQEN